MFDIGKRRLGALEKELERIDKEFEDVRGPVADTSTPRRGGRVDVLIFEDSDTAALAIRNTLLKHGVISVARMANANEWEKYVDLFNPRIILMDIMMPGMSGFEALRRIKRHQEYSKIPVVICSSKNGDSDIIWATKCGAAGYICKPWHDHDEFMMTIRSAMRNARAGRSLDLVL